MKATERLRQFPSASISFVLLVLLTLTLACTRRPAPQPREINVEGSSLVHGRGPNFVSRTYPFFVGSPTERFEMTLTLQDATTNCPMSVLSGDGTVLQTITTSGAHTVQFPGNVGMLRFQSAELGDTPLFAVDSFRIFPRSGAQVPAVPAAMTNNVAAMPVSLNNEIFLPFSNEPATYFLVAQGVAGKTVDVVLDGPGDGGAADAGRIFISTNTTNGFIVLDESVAQEVVRNSAGGISRLTLGPNQNTLMMTVRSQNSTGLARLSVNEVPSSGLVTLSARFTAPLPASATDITELRALVNRASQHLYRVTAGRMRIANLTVFTSLNAGGLLNQGEGDILITNVDPGVGVTSLPDGRIGLELGPASTQIGTQLAKEILRHNFPLIPERSNENGPLCPNSVMSDASALGLCWSRNHNPTGHPVLSAEVANSGWTILAPILFMTAPEATPPQILRNVSSITFPLQVNLIN